MHVRMKRRYRGGRKMSDREFSEQAWVQGILQTTQAKGIDVLGLYRQGPGHPEPPLGLLYRPVLAAVFSDSISFAGVEKNGDTWVHQTWYCETRGRIEAAALGPWPDDPDEA